MLFFFFQAEDGIRDKLVTGVQTCALPISAGTCDTGPRPKRSRSRRTRSRLRREGPRDCLSALAGRRRPAGGGRTRRLPPRPLPVRLPLRGACPPPPSHRAPSRRTRRRSRPRPTAPPARSPPWDEFLAPVIHPTADIGPEVQ